MLTFANLDCRSVANKTMLTGNWWLAVAGITYHPRKYARIKRQANCTHTKKPPNGDDQHLNSYLSA